ncbi:hypothetical protein PGT21_009769 [Puccinia graminis f. sp. tritici]|uniref:Fungal-type protein kinase domain-containing protein n=1 Tax=Puccinia graminis f. sp. tritici TaxID=56615 RepID=A0A5B0Q233_PUCGR|nr:hypothetical protein PGT21_009769 [Puccinia graminis f. sp. tritici]
MYDLIKKELIDLPSASSPSAITTASLVDSSERVDDLLPRLKLELQKLMYKDVPDLVEHLFQHHHVNFAEILQPHKSFIKQKYEERIDDTSEPSMLAWITPLVENCLTWLKEAGLNEQLSRAWVCPEQYLIGVQGRRKLDCAIVSQSFWRSNHFEDVLVPVELKKNGSDDRDANICLAKYVYEVFIAQPSRSYVIGLTLCGTSMRLWQFDRSGAIGSESFDIKKDEDNFSKFLAIILFLLTSSKQVLGFDSSFIDIAGQASTATRESPIIQIGTEPNRQELIIDRLIFRAHSICGRGTTCWQAHLSGDERTKFVVKDSWQPAHRTEEGVMLREVTEKNIPHMARYYHHEDVQVANQIVDIESHVRAGIIFRNGQTIETTSESVNSNHSDEFTNRFHRRLILKDVGEPIWKVDSPVRLLEALEGCIKGHQALLRAGYLHRDISISNLMINYQNDLNRKSFLIDLDVAIPYPTSNDQARSARAGTKVFMSINLLAQEHGHSFVDDLESFFWVLIWICIHYPKGDRTRSNLTGWNELDLETLKHTKRDLLAHPDELTDKFTQLYKESKPLITCVHEFAKIMGHDYVREEESETLYYQILDILQQAQKKLIEEQKLNNHKFRLEQGAEGAAVDGTDSASFQSSVEGGEEAQHSGGMGSLPIRINEKIDGESTAHRVNPVGSSAPRHSTNPSSSSRDRNVEHESRDQAPDPDGVIGVAQNRQEWPAWREHLEYITHAGAISLVTSHLARTWAPALMLEEEGSLSFVVTALAVGFYYWKHF